MNNAWIFGIVAVVVLTGCCGLSENSDVMPPLQTGEESRYCPTIHVPATVVPEKYEGSSDSFDYYLSDEVLDKEIIWDGWAWDDSPFGYGVNDLYCEYGKDEGENAAYLYCDSTLFGVEKSFTDTNGDVLEHKKYYIRLVYRPEGDGFSLTEIQYSDGYGIQDFSESECISNP